MNLPIPKDEADERKVGEEMEARKRIRRSLEQAKVHCRKKHETKQGNRRQRSKVPISPYDQGVYDAAVFLEPKPGREPGYYRGHKEVADKRRQQAETASSYGQVYYSRR